MSDETKNSTATQERSERQVAVVFATYRDVVVSLAGVEREVAKSGFRGEMVQLLPAEERRLDALGALVPKGREGAAAAAQAVIDRALNPADAVIPGPTEQVVVSPPGGGLPPMGLDLTGDPIPDAVPTQQQLDAQAAANAAAGGAAGGDGGSTPPADYDARGQSVTDLEAWIRTAKPTVPQVVSAANDDPEAAEKLQEAESLATGGDPRSTVVKGLQAVIDNE